MSRHQLGGVILAVAAAMLTVLNLNGLSPTVRGLLSVFFTIVLLLGLACFNDLLPPKYRTRGWAKRRLTELSPELESELRVLLPEAGQSFDHPPTADEIRQYVADNKETLDRHPELHVGGYRNTLGISGRYADENVAHTAAKKLDQISRYDLEKGKEVETGGTGKTTSFPEYPIEQRLADLSESHGLNTAELTKSPKGSSVPLMENPLKVKGTGEGERIA